MKLINNQHILLATEVKQLITGYSEIFIATGYTSIPSLFELIDEFEICKGVKLLLNSDPVDDSRFAYDPKEFSLYFDLTAAHKAKSVYNLIESKFQIRSGNVGGQKFILIKNTDATHCFSIVPQDLNAVTLVKVPSSLPIVLTQFEDQGGQYLQLFELFWSISSMDLKDVLLAKVKQSFDDQDALLGPASQVVPSGKVLYDSNSPLNYLDKK